MYIKVSYNIKNNKNNKKGDVRVQGARFDQNHLKLEKKTKKKKNKGDFFVRIGI